MRVSAFALAILLLAGLSCAPLKSEHEGLVDFTDIPAEWGQLVTVTKYDNTDYYELWFSNSETGSITHVPLYRPTWQIKPDRVRTMPRREPGVVQPGAGGES